MERKEIKENVSVIVKLEANRESSCVAVGDNVQTTANDETDETSQMEDEEDAQTTADEDTNQQDDADYVQTTTDDDELDETSQTDDENSAKPKITKIKSESEPDTTVVVLNKHNRYNTENARRKPDVSTLRNFCDRCDDAFKYPYQLARHVKIKHEGKYPYHCKVCNKPFDRISSLREHRFVHSDERPFSCNMCDKKFKMKGNLRKHVLEIHHEEVGGPKLKFQCEYCSKIFPTKERLTSHFICHDTEKAFPCDICGKKFNRKSNLNIHRLIHFAEKKFKCPECPMRFNREYSLKIHARNHLEVKPYRCELCPSSFSQLHALKTHFRMHTGEKPFKCTECPQTFRQLATLQVHLKRHSGIKDFACEVCGKAFVIKRRLVEHMRIHTGEKPFSCDMCDYKAATSSGLRLHKKTHFRRMLNSATAASSNSNSRTPRRNIPTRLKSSERNDGVIHDSESYNDKVYDAVINAEIRNSALEIVTDCDMGLDNVQTRIKTEPMEDQTDPSSSVNGEPVQVENNVVKSIKVESDVLESKEGGDNVVKSIQIENVVNKDMEDENNIVKSIKAENNVDENMEVENDVDGNMDDENDDDENDFVKSVKIEKDVDDSIKVDTNVGKHNASDMNAVISDIRSLPIDTNVVNGHTGANGHIDNVSNNETSTVALDYEYLAGEILYKHLNDLIPAVDAKLLFSKIDNIVSDLVELNKTTDVTNTKGKNQKGKGKQKSKTTAKVKTVNGSKSTSSRTKKKRGNSEEATALTDPPSLDQTAMYHTPTLNMFQPTNEVLIKSEPQDSVDESFVINKSQYTSNIQASHPTLSQSLLSLNSSNHIAPPTTPYIVPPSTNIVLPSPSIAPPTFDVSSSSSMLNFKELVKYIEGPSSALPNANTLPSNSINPTLRNLLNATSDSARQSLPKVTDSLRNYGTVNHQSITSSPQLAPPTGSSQLLHEILSKPPEYLLATRNSVASQKHLKELKQLNDIQANNTTDNDLVSNGFPWISIDHIKMEPLSGDEK